MICTITWNGLAIAACWLIGTAIAVADIFYGPNLAALAAVFVSIAAVRSIKGYVDGHAGSWTTAYEIGKETHKVRRIR
jgi:hypothetical protein